MATFQWIGSANNGNYSTAANWQPAVGAPPGANDTALIETPATPINGMGSAQILFTTGPVRLDGHFIAIYGVPVNAQPLLLQPGTVLTTPMLHSPVTHYSNTTAAELLVGADSRVVIAGSHIPDNYAIALAQGTGTNVTMDVEGAGALVNGGNQPILLKNSLCRPELTWFEWRVVVDSELVAEFAQRVTPSMCLKSVPLLLVDSPALTTSPFAVSSVPSRPARIRRARHWVHAIGGDPASVSASNERTASRPSCALDVNAYMQGC